MFSCFDSEIAIAAPRSSYATNPTSQQQSADKHFTRHPEAGTDLSTERRQIVARTIYVDSHCAFGEQLSKKQRIEPAIDSSPTVLWRDANP